MGKTFGFDGRLVVRAHFIKIEEVFQELIQSNDSFDEASSPVPLPPRLIGSHSTTMVPSFDPPRLNSSQYERRESGNMHFSVLKAMRYEDTNKSLRNFASFLLPPDEDAL